VACWLYDNPLITHSSWS